MTHSLEGKTAIVTGAASGMGRATVAALLDAGAAVVAGDVNEAGLAGLPSNPKLVADRCDVAVAEDVQGLVARAVGEFGGLNVVCNCAGIHERESVVDASEVWQRTMDINLTGVLHGCKFAIPALKQAGGGSIVNWASVSAFRAERENPAYSVSKAAVLMLTKCVAVEHAADGIRANALCPGWVDTPMVRGFELFESGETVALEKIAEEQPLGLGTPEAIADVAVFLSSDASRLMTGSAVLADGGLMALDG